MRTFFLAVSLLGVSLAAHGETLREWLNTAPPAKIIFSPWDGDFPSVKGSDNATNLAQNFYGYLDLSQLPAEVFPIKLRLIYGAPASSDVVSAPADSLSSLKDNASVDPDYIVEEALFDAPSEAREIPIWNEPSPIRQQLGYINSDESLRIEVVDRSGAVLGRRLIGTSHSFRIRPRAILVNTPGANQSFARHYRTVSEVKRLVPDSYAFVNVDTIWIDAATASDSSLTSTFWKQVLLGGTTVAGRPEDIGKLASRLELAPNQPVLLGKLVTADSPADFTQEQGPLQELAGAYVNVATAQNPFAFSIVIGRAMHEQLVQFSIFYLGAFVLLQALVIFVAFIKLRGTQRVWLWLVVPGFALAYTILGVLSAHGVVRARSDARLTQLEFGQEGWPQTVLLTHLEQINLADHETELDLPNGSRPYIPFEANNVSMLGGTFCFRHDGKTQIILHNTPATRMAADVRSVLDLVPPFHLTADAKLSPVRDFTGAWIWDGTNWHNLGPLMRNMQPIDWKETAIIYPSSVASGGFVSRNLQNDDNFPTILKPLLNSNLTRLMATSGEGIFLGVEPVADVHLDTGTQDRVASRRVIAYQFRLPRGTP